MIDPEFNSFLRKIRTVSSDILILNFSKIWEENIGNLLTFSIKIIQKYQEIFAEPSLWKAGSLDFEGIKLSKQYKNISQELPALQIANLNTLTKNEKLPFFINIYNILLVTGLIHLEVSDLNPVERQKFLKKISFNIGDRTYSSQMILNGILRGKPLYDLSLKNVEVIDAHILETCPEVLFTLLDFTKTGPKFNHFSALNFQTELQENIEKFVKGIRKNKKNVLMLPVVFTTFKEDYENIESQKLMEFLLKYLETDESFKTSIKVKIDHTPLSLGVIKIDPVKPTPSDRVRRPTLLSNIMRKKSSLFKKKKNLFIDLTEDNVIFKIYKIDSSFNESHV